MGDTTSVRVGPKGRVVLPVEARRALGIHEGDELVAVVHDDGVTLLTRGAAVARLRRLFGGAARSPVDDLLAGRRDEVAAEQRAETLARRAPARRGSQSRR
jgi:AbrB family looped-hinge helix DNA binding protein